MLCRNPYNSPQGMLFPCGQCMPCRVNRRREWSHRLMLESFLKADNLFVTLTYEDAALVNSASGLPTLVPSHLQSWLKRFRAAIAPLRVRFYGVGEYGEMSFRPHYHVIVFGHPMCRHGRTIRDVRTGQSMWRKCCDVCRMVGNTWNSPNLMGDVDCGEVNFESASYIAGYVTKKMTSVDDIRLKDRHPEFARMSLKPGIGADFMHDIASTLLQFDLAERQGDVPSALRHGSRLLPLGRYLRRQLRLTVGMEPNAPQSSLDEMAALLQPLREIAFDNSQSFKATVVSAADTKVAQMENKQRMFKKRGSI